MIITYLVGGATPSIHRVIGQIVGRLDPNDYSAILNENGSKDSAGFLH